MKVSRLKPDRELNSALTVLIKESPQLFCSPSSLDGLIAVLKREPSAIFKAKSNPSVYVLATRLLLLALKDSYDWPESVAKVEWGFVVPIVHNEEDKKSIQHSVMHVSVQ